MAARIHREADLLEVLGHGLRVAPGHAEAGSLALGRTDSSRNLDFIGTSRHGEPAVTVANSRDAGVTW